MTQDIGLEEQQGFYDARWKDHTFVNHAKLARCIAILESLASIKLQKPDIIELGSGSGWLTSVLGAFGPATGVELSPIAVAQARERYPSLRFVQADLHDWDYPREQFDLVVSHEVLEHLSDQSRHFELAHGLLREGGYLILTTPNKLIYDDLASHGQVEMQPIENWMTKSSLRLMAQRYLEIVRLQTIRPFPRRGVFRMVNYFKLRSVAERLCLRPFLENVLCFTGSGLHLLLVARKVCNT
jgi:SAM-dependent methyltransferase